MGVIIKNGRFYPPTTVGGNKAFYLHQDEYDALEKKKKDAMYFITSKNIFNLPAKLWYTNYRK